MKIIFAVFAIFAIFDTTFAQQDDCLKCVDDIQKAVEKCNAEGTTTLECVEAAMGAASDCLLCICEVMDEIIGGDGICNNVNPANQVPQTSPLND